MTQDQILVWLIGVPLFLGYCWFTTEGNTRDEKLRKLPQSILLGALYVGGLVAIIYLLDKVGIPRDSMGSIAIGVIIFAGILAWIYFLPTYIARKRNSAYFIPILIVNLVFGFTLIGWVGALVWAFWPQEQPQVIVVQGSSNLPDRKKELPAPSSKDQEERLEIFSVSLIGSVVEKVINGQNGSFFIVDDRSTGSFIQGCRNIDDTFLLDLNNKNGLGEIDSNIFSLLRTNGWKENNDAPVSLSQNFSLDRVYDGTVAMCVFKALCELGKRPGDPIHVSVVDQESLITAS